MDTVVEDTLIVLYKGNINKVSQITGKSVPDLYNMLGEAWEEKRVVTLILNLDGSVW